jgi:hypothetical protein
LYISVHKETFFSDKFAALFKINNIFFRMHIKSLCLKFQSNICLVELQVTFSVSFIFFYGFLC